MTLRLLAATLFASSLVGVAQQTAAPAGAVEKPTTKLQQFGDLGDLHLENGKVIRSCKIGYRTLGKLNSDNSNAVLFPTWLAGRSDNLVGLVGPGKIIDDSKFFVVLVDAIGDGVSCSPSNSVEQHGTAFPEFSVRDMVEAEHRLVMETLHLKHLHAVMGISMGGIQTMQWMVSYPEFMDRAVPIVGTPQPSSYDLLFLNMVVKAVQDDPEWEGGRYTKNPNLPMVRLLVEMNLTTPEFRVDHTSHAEFPKYFHDLERGADDFDANDRLYQMKAIIPQDVAQGGRLEDAAAKVKAKVLGHIVAAGPHGESRASVEVCGDVGCANTGIRRQLRARRADVRVEQSEPCDRCFPQYKVVGERIPGRSRPLSNIVIRSYTS